MEPKWLAELPDETKKMVYAIIAERDEARKLAEVHALEVLGLEQQLRDLEAKFE